MIKRVVALPGDEVRVRGGRLHVNGCAQQEPYVARRMGYRLGTKRVPDGHVFVLGDNRDASCDSHVWGSLSQSLLIGVPLCTYWPPSRVRRRRAYSGSGASTTLFGRRLSLSRSRRQPASQARDEMN